MFTMHPSIGLFSLPGLVIISVDVHSLDLHKTGTPEHAQQMFYTCSPLGNLYSSMRVGSGVRSVTSRIMLQVGHVAPNVYSYTFDTKVMGTWRCSYWFINDPAAYLAY